MNTVVQASENDSKSILGFWIYLMTDCVLFASLFAVYAVTHSSTFGGPDGRQLFNLPFVLLETMVLLTSSFSCGLAVLAGRQLDRQKVLWALAITFVLGASFLILELSEFHLLVAEGNSWRRSGFLSAYFALVGTHGLHIAVGLLWIVVNSLRIAKRGLNVVTQRRLILFSLFWHFLDIIWIIIFSMVFLVGSI
jgi:cytochrome o ubiquinol oxidase subunit 3